jgi:hypothetical protein
VTPMATCPCCGGTGRIELSPPVELTPLQRWIYDAVRTSRFGIPGPMLVARIYADRIDGGPLYAIGCMYLAIRDANRRLAVA